MVLSSRPWRLKRQATKLEANPGCPATTATSRRGASRSRAGRNDRPSLASGGNGRINNSEQNGPAVLEAGHLGANPIRMARVHGRYGQANSHPGIG